MTKKEWAITLIICVIITASLIMIVETNCRLIRMTEQVEEMNIMLEINK